MHEASYMQHLPVVFTSSSCAEALWSRATWNMRCAHHATNAGHHEFEYGTMQLSIHRAVLIRPVKLDAKEHS